MDELIFILHEILIWRFIPIINYWSYRYKAIRPALFDQCHETNSDVNLKIYEWEIIFFLN